MPAVVPQNVQLSNFGDLFTFQATRRAFEVTISTLAVFQTSEPPSAHRVRDRRVQGLGAAEAN